MDTDKIKLEMRLTAIEYLVANLYVKIFRLAGIPSNHVVDANAEALRTFDTKTFPELGPAWSDVTAQELADNIGRVMSMIEAMMGTAPVGGERPR